MNEKLDLKTILKLHALWLVNDPGGSRADLAGADLAGADLAGADLAGANLTRANLIRADLIRANLIGANLTRANIAGADLSGANLTRANIAGADLSGANLTGANLAGANLKGTNGADLALAMSSHLPEGPFIGWKKCKDGVIVKLLIPEDARRSHGAERKCRAEYVGVVEVFGAGKGISIHDGKTEYIPGRTVRAHAWDEDMWNTCAPGIHFFITRLEAEAYGE